VHTDDGSGWRKQRQSEYLRGGSREEWEQLETQGRRGHCPVHLLDPFAELVCGVRLKTRALDRLSVSTRYLPNYESPVPPFAEPLLDDGMANARLATVPGRDRSSWRRWMGVTDDEPRGRGDF